MAYPFAHPAAALALSLLMGRFAVPSALVIGTISPDLWYLVPVADRHVSHSALGLLLFCLPIGVAAYLLFHLLLKEPCISLLPPTLAGRVRPFAVTGLPAVPLHAVFGSLVVGALSHLLWDGATHSPAVAMEPVNWVQHATTLVGLLVLAYWVWRKLRSVTPSPSHDVTLSRRARAWAWTMLLTATALSAAWSAGEWPPIAPDLATLRHITKAAGAAVLQGFAVAAALYCAAWKLRSRSS